jgi:O-antigen/teichoic acid export membrane protein
MRGNNWIEAVHVIQILALVGAARAITLLVGPLMQAINRPRLSVVLSWSLAGANTVAFCIAGWMLQDVASVRLQAMGVAGARAIVFCVFYMPVSLYIMCRICQLAWRDVIKSIMPALLTSAIVTVFGLCVEAALGTIKHPSAMMKMTELFIGGSLTTAVAGYLMYLFEPSVGSFVRQKLNRGRKREVITVNAGEPTEFEAATAAEEATVIAVSGTEESDLHGTVGPVPTSN